MTCHLLAGDDCPFAHGVYEVLLHPLRYRTELCKDFVQRGFCARDVCFFAHFPSEQRTPDEETMVRYNVLQVRGLVNFCLLDKRSTSAGVFGFAIAHVTTHCSGCTSAQTIQ